MKKTDRKIILGLDLEGSPSQRRIQTKGTEAGWKECAGSARLEAESYSC